MKQLAGGEIVGYGYKEGPQPSMPWALTPASAPCSKIEGYHAWRDTTGKCECGEHDWPIAEEVAEDED